MSGDGKRGGAQCVSTRAHPRLYKCVKRGGESPLANCSLHYLSTPISVRAKITTFSHRVISHSPESYPRVAQGGFPTFHPGSTAGDTRSTHPVELPNGLNEKCPENFRGARPLHTKLKRRSG